MLIRPQGNNFLSECTQYCGTRKINSNVYGLNIDVPPASLKLTLLQNRVLKYVTLHLIHFELLTLRLELVEAESLPI